MRRANVFITHREEDERNIHTQVLHIGHRTLHMRRLRSPSAGRNDRVADKVIMGASLQTVAATRGGGGG